MNMDEDEGTKWTSFDTYACIFEELLHKYVMYKPYTLGLDHV